MAAQDDPLLIDIPTELRGERVLVRRLEDSDAPSLFSAIDESRDNLTPWMPWAAGHVSVDDSLVYIRRSGAQWLSRERLGVGIFDLSDGRLLGCSGLERIDWPLRHFEIGYWARASAEGHGYIGEAVRVLTRFAFDDLRANRVDIRMDPRNTRSRRVAERAGYLLEGTLRNVSVDASGAPADRHIFALTPADYSRLPWRTV
jgi:RimJ/RimL family protein N-acetyltransferase